MTNLPAIITLLSAGFQLVLAGWVLLRSPRHPVHLSFCLGMLALAVETTFSFAAGSEQSGGLRVVSFLATALVASPWMAFSLTYSRGDRTQSLRRAWLLLAFSVAIPLGIAFGFPDELIVANLRGKMGTHSALSLGRAGTGLGIFSLVTGIFVLTNLERTFRSSVGIMRWRIKYMVLGLAVLFAFRLYRSSQNILYSALNPAMSVAEAAVDLLACALISVSLRREKIFDVDVYPSHAFLFQSVTILLTGIYLVIIGILAQLVRFMGGASALPLQAFLIMLALVGMTIGLLSERLRRRLHLFVSRHLRRPVYDYRQVWITFTTQTASRVDEASFCHSVASWLAETFRALSVNVWLMDDSRDQFRLAGSTSLTAAAASQLDGDGKDWKPMIAAMTTRPEPVDLDTSQESWAGPLRERCPGFFSDGGHRLCLPLTSGGELIGLILAGDRVAGVPFTAEDLDLLKCVGDQVAAGLLNLRLSKQLLRAKEFEAFQTMSAFFVHDLKNTASTLSLTLQNLREHFGNPAFRDDALRAVSKSVQHLEQLIGRLSLLRQELDIHPVRADLSLLVEEVLKNAGALPEIRLNTKLQPLCFARFDPEQFGKVVLNLLLNARDAVGSSGSVEISTATTSEWAILKVADTGCGMTSEFIRKSLFRPFQTTKKRGIGIGMFQSKLIIDAHGGRVQVDSQLGEGTSFQIMIPLAPEIR